MSSTSTPPTPSPCTSPSCTGSICGTGTPASPPHPETVLEFPGQADGLNGSCLLTPGVLVLADSLAGLIWRVDLGPPRPAPVSTGGRRPSRDAQAPLRPEGRPRSLRGRPRKLSGGKAASSFQPLDTTNKEDSICAPGCGAVSDRSQSHIWSICAVVIACRAAAAVQQASSG